MTRAGWTGRRPVFAERPTVIGHRGSGASPHAVADARAATDAGQPEQAEQVLVENTLDSVLAGVRAGVRWVEIDVRRTADDTLVVLHNPKSTAGEFVAEIRAEQATEAGLPQLADILDALPPEIGLDLDVKTSLEDATRPAWATTAALLAPVLRRESRRRAELLVTSFDAAALLQIRAAVPDIPLGLLTWIKFPLRKAIPTAAHLGLEVVAVHTGSLLPERDGPGSMHHDPAYAIDVAHQAGLEVAAWCPSPEAAVRLAEAGTDAFVVDDLAGVLTALRGAPAAGSGADTRDGATRRTDRAGDAGP